MEYASNKVIKMTPEERVRRLARKLDEKIRRKREEYWKVAALIEAIETLKALKAKFSIEVGGVLITEDGVVVNDVKHPLSKLGELKEVIEREIIALIEAREKV